MSRYRLTPTPEQETTILLEHCAHARYVWNLAVEQHSWYPRRRRPAPGYVAQCRQLTEARAENEWLARGSQMVQQQALRDFDQALRNFFRGTHGKPGFRKKGASEGFRVVAVKAGDVRRVSRNTGEVKIPKAGWVRFRWSRAVPEARSLRVTRDRAGRWHAAFAAVPDPVAGPGTGEVVGVDRGVTVSAALSTGELLTLARLSQARQARRKRLQRQFARAQRGSNRRRLTKLAIARLTARETDTRKDWCEKVSTSLARRFDIIRIEDLQITNMTRSATGSPEAPGRNVAQKAGLNREILASGWGLLARRLDDKAPGRVEKINPAYTSQCCSACGHIAADSRKSQALFACVACGFARNADVNAAINIAAGRAVTARRGDRATGPAKREPHELLLAS